METDRPTRLAVVLSHPVQYYSPWFQQLSARPGLALRVFYLWDFGVAERRDPQFGQSFKWDVDLLSGYEHEFVPNLSADPGTHHFRGLNNPQLTERLAAWRPDAVLLFGYNWQSLQAAFWWCRRQRIPVIFRGDSHLLGRPRQGMLKEWILRRVFRRFSSCTYVGQANRDYLLHHGVHETNLFFAPHAVDGARFADPSAAAAGRRLRRDLGLDQRRVVLFAGKFVERKQPLELLRAFKAVADEGDALVFVGDGELRSAIEAEITRPPSRQVKLLPFANQSEMPVTYHLADIFALPSKGGYETWGLAVNEAMHAGRPCLVSDVVGCQRDLVTENETGWVFPAEDQGALVSTLRRALRMPATDLAAMGERAKQRVAGYSYEAATKGLMEAVDSALRRR